MITDPDYWRVDVPSWRSEPATLVFAKLDGLRLTVIKDEKGRISAYSRGRNIDWFLRLNAHQRQIVLQLRDLPPETVADGELHAPGVPATSVVTRVVSGGHLEFAPFHVPLLGGKRPTMAEALAVPFHVQPEELEVDRGLLLAEARRRGIEGFVLREGYSWRWYKLKGTKTVDAVVTEQHRGTGRHAHRLGAVSIWVEDRDLGRVGTGFSDADRNVFWKQSLVGKVIEVEYDCLAANGKLRFPRFVRVRDDKEPHQCLKSQL